MKRLFAVTLVLGLVAGTMGIPAEAKKKKKPHVREYEVRYENPALGAGGVGGGCSGCPGISTATDEYFAVIEVVDDVSPTGYIDLAYDADGDGIQDLGSGPTVCGSTPEPIAIEAGTSYTAWPWLVGVGCPGGSSTSGTIKVLLSNDLAALEKAAGGGD